MSNITEKDIKLFYEMLERDKNSAHFLWTAQRGLSFPPAPEYLQTFRAIRWSIFAKAG